MGFFDKLLTGGGIVLAGLLAGSAYNDPLRDVIATRPVSGVATRRCAVVGSACGDRLEGAPGRRDPPSGIRHLVTAAHD